MLTTVLAAIVVAAVGLMAYVASEASYVLVYGELGPRGCPTPAVMGWQYEAVNYDISLDQQLPMDNPHWLTSCRHHGAGTAGTEVVSRDGVRVAGWYIPSADGDAPTASTVVLLHGWGANASEMLRYGATIHDRYNLLLVDLRARGRSSGERMTFGVFEALDVQAMVDWLERTKAPSDIALLGLSGGAAAGLAAARDDDRIDAVIVDSIHARAAEPIERRLQPSAEDRLGPFAPPGWLSAWLAEVGIWARTGAWVGDAEPVESVAELGMRPLAIIYGTDDTLDVPERNALVLYRAAETAGVSVEIHACEGGTHGQVVDICPAAYRTWVRSFLERTIGP